MTRPDYRLLDTPAVGHESDDPQDASLYGPPAFSLTARLIIAAAAACGLAVVVMAVL